MTRRHCSKLSAISAIQIIFIVGLSAGQRGNEKPDALKGFPDRVDMYIDLQRKAESGLPPFKETDSPEKMDAHRVTLASAIRAARAHAKPDDILNGASEQFRAIISEDARERSARDSLAAMQEVPKLTAPRVNAAYPAKSALATVPPLILKRLPLLPEGLEYRFMGRDLILRDVKANLIVDFVHEAVPTIRK